MCENFQTKFIASCYSLINSFSLNNSFLWGGNLSSRGKSVVGLSMWWGVGEEVSKTLLCPGTRREQPEVISLNVRFNISRKVDVVWLSLRVSSMFFIISGFFSYDFDVTIAR